MTRAAIDIGSNSIRLLIVADDGADILRLQHVTGLGVGVDAERRLSDGAVERTLDVLAAYRRHCHDHGVTRLRAVATSAARDAENREEFFDRTASVLQVRPESISGAEEAELAFTGATLGRDGEFVVVDIGGGSTEFVYRADGLRTRSIDIGSVRLTDRLLPDRPARFAQLEGAGEHVARLFEAVEAPAGSEILGVAGTWTSLAAIVAGTAEAVDGRVLDRLTADLLVIRLAGLSVEDTARLPGLDPRRAPVILAGAVIARQAMRQLNVEQVTVSERDLLDGVVARLSAL